jgi:hypothetical protein
VEEHCEAKGMSRWLSILLLLSWCVAAVAGNTDYTDRIADLIKPEKLATLGPRRANPRIQKTVAQLEAAKKDGQKIEKVAAKAVAIAGYTNTSAAKLTVAALLRNYDIANKLGCLDDAGLAEMRRGKSPTVKTGPYRGQELSVDHIIPRAVVPELDCVIANLELLPLRLNESKNAKIGERQRSLALKLHDAGLLSAEGLKNVQKSTR